MKSLPVRIQQFDFEPLSPCALRRGLEVPTQAHHWLLAFRARKGPLGDVAVPVRRPALFECFAAVEARKMNCIGGRKFSRLFLHFDGHGNPDLGSFCREANPGMSDSMASVGLEINANLSAYSENSIPPVTLPVSPAPCVRQSPRSGNVAEDHRAIDGRQELQDLPGWGFNPDDWVSRPDFGNRGRCLARFVSDRTSRRWLVSVARRRWRLQPPSRSEGATLNESRDDGINQSNSTAL